VAGPQSMKGLPMLIVLGAAVVVLLLVEVELGVW
jgi:hypothetical protein